MNHLQTYIRENSRLRAAESHLIKENKFLELQMKEMMSIKEKENAKEERDKESKDKDRVISDLIFKDKANSDLLDSQKKEISELFQFKMIIENAEKLEGGYKIISVKDFNSGKEKETRLMKDFKIYQETIKKKDEKIIDQSNKIREISLQLENQENQLTTKENELLKLSQQISSFNKYSKETQAEVAGLKKEVMSLTNTIKEKETLTSSLSRDLRIFKEKHETIRKDLEAKAKDAEMKDRLSDNLGCEINNLKDELHKKIHIMNGLKSKTSLLTDTEIQLKQEKENRERLLKELKEENDKCIKLEKKLREEVERSTEALKEIQLHATQIELKSSEIGSLKLNASKLSNDLASLRLEIGNLREGLSFEKKKNKETEASMKELKEKLEEAEALASRYDIKSFEKNVEEMNKRRDSIIKACDKVLNTIESMKIMIICRKCGKLPIEGKTLYPCGHCYCSSCFDGASHSKCDECQKEVDNCIRNVLIDDIKNRYVYIQDAIVGIINM